MYTRCSFYSSYTPYSSITKLTLAEVYYETPIFPTMYFPHSAAVPLQLHFYRRRLLRVYVILCNKIQHVRCAYVFLVGIAQYCLNAT